MSKILTLCVSALLLLNSVALAEELEVGLASWYGPGFHGKRMANGKVYNMHAPTAAHKELPLGTVVKVTNLQNNKSAVVTITDRGPFIEGRIIDLSKLTAHQLDILKPGTSPVVVEVIKLPK